MYHCDVCDKVFQSICKLDVHYRCHTDERPFTCNICQKGFRQKGHLSDHIKLHGKMKSYKCTICGEGFKQSSGLRHHKARSHGVEDVGNVVTVKRRLGRPRKRKSETVENQEAFGGVDVQSLHKCDVCHEMFPTATRLKNHMDWHTRRKRYKCLVCSHVFKHLKVFRKHQKVHEKSQEQHHQMQPSTETQSDDIHKLTNDYLKESFCKTCQKSFSCVFALNRHILEHHKGQKRKRKTVAPSFPVKKKHKCYICQKEFANIYTLKVHRARIHPSQIHKCNVCGRSYGVFNDLIRHYKTHGLHMPYKCNVCAKSFQYISKLKDHYVVHAKSQGSRECDVCGKRFLYLSRLKKHLVTHEEPPTEPNFEWPYECNVCQKVFRYPSRLREHHKIHFKENQHKCNVCGRTFKFLRHMLRHQTCHTKEQLDPTSSSLPSNRPLKCNVCGKLFQHQSQLKEHFFVHTFQPLNVTPYSGEPCRKKQKQEVTMSTASSEEIYHQQGHEIALSSYDTFRSNKSKPGKKPYSCCYCGRTFHQTNHLKRHCESQHNTNKPFRCNICLVAFERKVQHDDHKHTCEAIPLKRPRGRPPKKLPKVPSASGLCRTQSAEVASLTSTSGTQTTSEYTEKNKSEKKQYTLTRKKTIPTCNICGAQFSSTTSLRTHLDIHYDRRPYACRFCEMKFRQLGHLSNHCKKVHNEEFPYQCNLCSATFKGPILVKKHMQIAHGLTEKPSELDGFQEPAIPRYSNIDYEPKQYIRIVNPNSEQIEYACGFCDPTARTFKSLSGLRRHITVVHTTSMNQRTVSRENGHCQITWNRKAEESPTSKEIYKCNVCSVIVHGGEALEAHERAHTKTNVQSPSSTSSLTSASIQSEPDIKQTFECKFCDEKFDSMSREAFDQHQLDHELAAEEPMGMSYMCIECDKEFAIASDLVKHHEETH